jgi:hypothetical protein
MKSVKSIDALKRLALVSGSSASIAGRQFNEAGDRVTLVPPTPKVDPTPEPLKAVEIPAAPPVVPPAPDVMPAIQGALDSIEGYAANAAALSESNARVIAQVQKVLDRISSPTEAPPPCKWVFSVERDTRGLMTRVVATPMSQSAQTNQAKP